MSVSKGQLDAPCLSGRVCSVTNSECRAGVCVCMAQFYEKDNACRTFLPCYESTRTHRIANMNVAYELYKLYDWGKVLELCGTL